MSQLEAHKCCAIGLAHACPWSLSWEAHSQAAPLVPRGWNMDQSQGTPVLPTKATLDQPVASGLPDMEAVSAKMSQVQPRSGESHTPWSWTNTSVAAEVCGWSLYSILMAKIIDIPFSQLFWKFHLCSCLPIHLLQGTSYKPSTFLNTSCNTGRIKSISIPLLLSGMPHAFPMNILLIILKIPNILFGDKLWVFSLLPAPKFVFLFWWVGVGGGHAMHYARS